MPIVASSAQCRSSTINATGATDRGATGPGNGVVQARRPRPRAEPATAHRHRAARSRDRRDTMRREHSRLRRPARPRHSSGGVRRTHSVNASTKGVFGDDVTVVATAHEHDAAGGMHDAVAQFVHEPRLADARFARDQHQPAGPVDCFVPTLAASVSSSRSRPTYGVLVRRPRLLATGLPRDRPRRRSVRAVP